MRNTLEKLAYQHALPAAFAIMDTIRMKHSHGALGGSFDRLHKGHRSLLKFAFRLAHTVTIGLVTDELLSTKSHTARLQSYAERKQSLEAFLQKYSFMQRAHIVPLSDMYGPTRTDPTIDALVVTAETASNGRKINSVRKQHGLPALKLYVMPLIKGTDHTIIRSERIRAGLIDREGYTYASFFRSHPHLVLPDAFRARMRRPLGSIFADETGLIAYLNRTQHTLLITIGDIVTQTLHRYSIIPHVSVVDYKTRRSTLPRPPGTHPFIHNKPGSIQAQAVSGLRRAIQQAVTAGKKSFVRIEGEEDLLALPAILLAPLDSLILYGQYNLGIIVTPVTEQVKNSVLQLLKQFHAR